MTPSGTGPSLAWNDREGLKRACFRVALFTLFTAGSIVSLRAAIASLLRAEFLDPIDPLHANAMIGAILGAPFASFGVTLVLLSSVLPAVGYRRALLLASACLSGGLLLLVLADHLAGNGAIAAMLMIAMVVQGIGWGCVEATVNPLVGGLFPDDQTHKLSILHAWYPAGIVAGSLVGLMAGDALGWRGAALICLVLAVLAGVLAWRTVFPPVTIGDAAPVTIGQMFGALRRQPTIFFWLVIMMMTATTEFAPGQWVDIALSQIVGMRGILLLAYVSGLMFVMRHFAGPLVHRLSRLGLLTVSAVLSAIGLLALAHAATPLTAFAAATIWGCGVCFLWPTMLATVSARYPQGGPLVFGLLAAAGAASTYVTLPVIGGIYDAAKLEAAGSAAVLATASGAQLEQILAFAASRSFSTVAIIPAVLAPLFLTLWLVGRRRQAANRMS